MRDIIIYIGFILLIAACEDPIEVNLDSAPSQVVVDAWLTNESVPQSIKLTYSQDYLNSQLAQSLEDATVQIQSDNGNNYDFNHVGSGRYVWTPMPGRCHSSNSIRQWKQL